MPYAAQTKVPISKTKTDIEELLAKHGASGFAYATEGDRSLVAFSMSGRRVQIMLVMPSIDDFARTRNTKQTAAAQRIAWEQACRQRWRAFAANNQGRAGGSGVGHHHVGGRVPGKLGVAQRRNGGRMAGTADRRGAREGRMPPMLGTAT